VYETAAGIKYLLIISYTGTQCLR